MMKKLLLTLSLLLNSIDIVHATEPLKVGTTQFTYPFVIQGGNHQLFGFDIAMMTYICATLQRKCEYHIMKFDELLPAVASKKIDVAVNSITITPERAEIVNFSTPYLVSETRFLAQENMSQTPFSVKLLSTSKIGGLTGTITKEEIVSLGVDKPDITYFNEEGNMIEALNAGHIDLALVDEPTAAYWAAHSAGALIAFGKPIKYGFGLGIAVNKDETDLLKAINAALLKYQSSKNFKIDYAMYIEYALSTPSKGINLRPHRNRDVA